MAPDDVAIAKMADLRRRLDRIRTETAGWQPTSAVDERAVESVALNVLLAVQDAVDICARIISREGWDPPESPAGGFAELQRRGVLTAETAQAMARGTRLRNLIVHGYSRVDPQRLVSSAVAGIAEFEKFLADVGRWEIER